MQQLTSLFDVSIYCRELYFTPSWHNQLPRVSGLSCNERSVRRSPAASVGVCAFSTELSVDTSLIELMSVCISASDSPCVNLRDRHNREHNMNIWPIARDFVNFLTTGQKSTKYGDFSVALLVLFPPIHQGNQLGLASFLSYPEDKLHDCTRLYVPGGGLLNLCDKRRLQIECNR